jgi:hypothetical protein
VSCIHHDCDSGAEPGSVHPALAAAATTGLNMDSSMHISSSSVRHGCDDGAEHG